MGAEDRGNVLVVDDSAVVRAVVRQYLRSAGYRVDEADSGLAALRLLESGNYDVVITDLRMPELDGLGVLAEVKQRAINAEVIILTGTHANDIGCAVRALRLGAHDYLTKPPSSPEEVILTVERAVEKKRLRETNLRLMRELEALSRTDPLTGLLNRRALDEAFHREIGRAHRYGTPLSLVLLDLDHFKQVNDTHGHLGGDEVLRTFARLAKAAFRDTDMIFRFGGEEFAGLLPQTDPDAALEAARRFVSTVAEAPIRLGGSVVRVTCSAGVAGLEASDSQGSSFLARADAALYKAKRAGRNRAHAWDAAVPSLSLAG